MAPTQPVAIVMGASRGIGRQVAIDLAKANYAVVVAAKSTSDASTTTPFPPDPNSPASTISTVAREIAELGLTALAVSVDTRDVASIEEMFRISWQRFGRLDVLVYNPGAIWWASVQNTPMKRFQLMQKVNVEGLYGAIQSSLPYFERAGWKGRVIVVSPPIYSRFFRGKTAYAMGRSDRLSYLTGVASRWCFVLTGI